MKKVFFVLTILLIILCSGYTLNDEVAEYNFDIDDLVDYQKIYKGEEIETCSNSSVKTYMDYRAINSRASKQYWFIQNHMSVDDETGFLYDEEGFIGVALGSYYGEIGDRFYFTLDTGVVLPLVKIDGKADVHTDESGCYQAYDNSIIEFVIDKNLANEYFGYYGNGLVLSGNYNNYELFRGQIVKVEKVLDEKNENYVTFEEKEIMEFDNTDIFDYGSGY